MIKSKKYYGILAAIVISVFAFLIGFCSPNASKTTISLITDGSKNEASHGGEIWLSGIEIDGQKAALSQYPVSGKWKRMNGSIVYMDNEDGKSSKLVLSFTPRSDVRLFFGKHEWSGIVGIQDGDNYTELDLYDLNGQCEYQVSNIIPFYYSLEKLIVSIILFMIFIFALSELITFIISKNKRHGWISVIITFISIQILLQISSLSYCVFNILLLLVLYVSIHGKNNTFRKKNYAGIWFVIVLCWIYRIYYLTHPNLLQPSIVNAALLGMYLLILLGKKNSKLMHYGTIAALPVFCYLIIECVSNVNLKSLSISASAINILILVLCNIIISNLFDRKIGLYLMPVLSLIVSTVNYYIIQFKKFPLMPADVLQFQTAMAVAGDYQYKLSVNIVIGLLLVLFVWLLLYLYVPSEPFCWKKCFIQKGAAIGAFVFLAAWVSNVDFIEEYHIVKNEWAPSETYSENGFVLSFLAYLQEMYPDKPETYSKEKVKQILERYPAENTENTEKPTIIAIMNESFSDLNVLGELENDSSWFINSYDNFLEKGSTYMSVRGGGTCNSEFEFLTGNSMRYFAETYPYTQYNFSQVPTLVSNLKENGYEAIAMHPANATNYKRQTVYQEMGFDKFYSYDDYKEYDRIFLDRTSDYDGYRKIIEIVEAAESPQFIFNVTIQNHGDYNLETLNKKYTPINIDSRYSEFQDLQMYLTLMDESNKALEYLIKHFEKESKPVMIVFFGDHQPGCLNVDFEEKFFQYDESKSELANKQRYYATPYFFWANFDIKDAEDDETGKEEITSPNYLATKLLRYAGLPQTPYEKFLGEMQENILATNKFGYLGNDGIWYEYQEDSPYMQWIEEYEILQYYNMFDF